MKDNVSSWEDSGSMRKPEWEATNPDGTSAPISHTKGQHIRVRVGFDVSPDTLPPTSLTITGASAHSFFSFTGSTSAAGGAGQELELVSRGALPDAIDDRFQGATIRWTATVSGRSQPLGSSLDHGVFVTYDVPSGGVTQKRVATAVHLTKGFGNDPHAIVSGEMKRFRFYNLKKGYMGNIWPLADDIADSAECQAIVRFVQAVNKMVGVPGEAAGIAVYASPDAPDTPIVATLLETGGATGAMSDVPPQSGTGFKAFLFDGADQANNYEAALQFKFGIERFYPGGVPGGVGLTSTHDVLHSFTRMAWARFNVVTGKWEPVVEIRCYRPPC
jgi:hypothetical protein